MKKMFFPLLVLLGCSQAPHKQVSYELVTYEFPLKKYSKLIEGGFSGLYFEGIDQQKNFIFWTHTDRGPNAEIYQDTDGRMVRPFIQPNYNPHLIKFAFNPGKHSLHYLAELPLKKGDGKDLSGLPNKRGTGHETPVTVLGRDLDLDLLGIDPEGLCFTDQNIWMVEEYGPSLLKFDRQGKLSTRYVPKGYYSTEDLKELKKKYGASLIKETLSEKLIHRKTNRGFEGIACHEDKIYAVLQSPLPDETKDIRVLEFDSKTENVSREFIYQLDSLHAEKIGDLFFSQGYLYFIEQNSLTGEAGVHKIFRASLETKDGVLEKELVADLVKLGFDFADKVEGLTVLPSGDIFIVNDNDFGLTGSIDQKNKEANVDSNRKSILGHLQKKSL